MTDDRQKIDRLKEIFGVKTDEALAEKLDVTLFAVRSWKQRNSLPKKYELILMQKEMKNTSFDPALLREQKETDKKDFLDPNKKFDLELLRAEKERVQVLKGNVPIRYFENVTASAGYGSNNSDESFEEFEVGADFLRTVLQVKPTKYGYDMIRVLGDSMEPFVQDGDIIVIDRHTDIKNGDVVIANLGQDTFTKKFLRDPLHNSIKLTSLSEYYQDIVLRGDEIEELRIVGKVVCKFSINMKVF
ncbi:S24 family peptidase [Campylobacter sp. MOP7]|uniref:LexA family transcriptional regulator n=1 Tax=Campylobacter canis TaxID=3378588 RepID=UPI00387E3B5E